MEKFVSSLKHCKKDAVLFHPLRKTKYNHLKKKLKNLLTENDISECDENKDKKKKSNMKSVFGKLKKLNLQELTTVVDEVPVKGKNKRVKQKQENKNKLKIAVEPETISMKPKKNRTKKPKPYLDAKVEKKRTLKKSTSSDEVVYNQFLESKYSKLQKNSPGNILLEKETSGALEINAEGSISEEYPESEEISFVDLDTTSSPIIVQRKRGPIVTHPLIRDCVVNTHMQDDFSEEFSSVLSCFCKNKKSSKVVSETCKVSSQSNKFPLEQDRLSSVTEEKKPKIVPVKNLSYEIHSLPGCACVLTMRHPCELFVQGKVKVTVLKGTVNVLGFTLTAENTENGVSVFCPQRCMCLSIASHKLQECAQNTSYIKKLEALKASYSKLLNECLASDCVLLLQETSSNLTKFLNVHFSIKLFPKVSSSSDRQFYKEENKLQCQLDTPDSNVGARYLTIKDEWEQVISEMSLFADGSKTVVLGGKGVGKSTFLRYLANSCMSRCGAVLWLDFDPGQAEFTVPGCLSVVLVKEPLLGPNFMHLTSPLRTVYLGEIDVSRCPSRYNSCVEHIVKYCFSQPDLQNIPWLINTMGYNKGLGIELAISIIRLLRPTNVIHIESKRQMQNFAQPLRSNYVNSYVSTWSSVSAECGLDYSTHILPSAVASGTSNAPGLKPSESRELMVLAYLSQVVSRPLASLLSVVPYCSPLARLVLAVCHETVAQSNVLAAMNGSLVALCSCDERRVWTSNDPDMARIMPHAPVTPCLGFGIVRGVDMVEKTVYLTTPVLEEDMSKVNCLLMGAVNLPPCIRFAVQPGSGHVPYVSRGSQQPMSRVTRSTFRRL